MAQQPQKKSTGGRTRKVVGQKQQEVEAESTQVPKGGFQKQSTEQSAEEANAKDTDGGVVYITATNTSSFQLRAEQRDANGRVTKPEWMVNFDVGGLHQVREGDETHKAFEAVLDGKWHDERVDEATFLQNARYAGIGIKAFGLESAPYATWDTAEEAQVIPLAIAVGVLGSADDVRKALKYEKQSGKRTPRRAVRDGVVAQLEAILASYEAVPQNGPATVVHAAGGNTVGQNAVQVGTAGIGFATGLQELG